jgi:O-antigen/teichoic acid export membrane protein
MKLGQISIVYFATKVIASIIGAVAMIYFARILGAETIGIYSLVTALVAWLNLGGRMGVSEALIKRVSEGDEPGAYVAAGITMMIGLTGLLVAGVFLARGQIESYIGAPVIEFLILILIAGLFSTYVNALLKGYHLVHIYSVLALLKTISKSLLQIGLVMIGYGLVGLLVGWVLGAVLVGIIGIIIVSADISMPQKRHFISLFDYAKYSWLGSVRSRSFSYVDILVLGVFVSPTLVGIYSVAWSVSKVLDMFSSAIATTLFPEISKISAQEGKESVSGLVNDSLVYGGLILIPGLVGAALLGDEILRVYGEEFVEGAEVLTILLAGMLIYGYQRHFKNTLNAVDRPDLALRLNAAFIFTNLALNFGLIYLIGWVGAAVATASSAFVGLVIGYWYLRKLIDFEIPVYEISLQWISALVMGGIIYSLLNLNSMYSITSNEIVIVLSLVSVGSGVYFLLLLVMSTKFRQTAKNNSPIPV